MVAIQITRISETHGRVYRQQGDQMVAICDVTPARASELTAALCRIHENTPPN